ncbi:MAG TPA: hypothetical protein VFH70_04210 [Acidimicrobiales bacterium]|nr:hypothetical protein [Acidimicrobiales bacterium]
MVRVGTVDPGAIPPTDVEGCGDREPGRVEVVLGGGWRLAEVVGAVPGACRPDVVVEGAAGKWTAGTAGGGSFPVESWAAAVTPPAPSRQITIAGVTRATARPSGTLVTPSF